jgi:phage protein D
MALTDSQRNQIASYKAQILNYRNEIDNIKKNKKSKSEYYANEIKGTKDANSKRNYRASKERDMAQFANQIESKKRSIEQVKGYIKSIK